MRTGNKQKSYANGNFALNQITEYLLYNLAQRVVMCFSQNQKQKKTTIFIACRIPRD